MSKLLSVLIIMTCLISSSSLAAEKPAHLENLSATEAANLIKDGVITSEELVTVLSQRMKEHADLNAFINVDIGGALRAAREADKASRDGRSLGLLHGVPVAIKDNIDARGFPTTVGTPALEYYYPGEDSGIVALLRQEGAIIIGKTNLHELGFGITCDNVYYGAVKNPYNLGYMVGGSSGGNGAALAAKLIPLAIGSDTGGSIRIPASLTGVYGYRPSVGRYPMQGFIPMAPTKDVIGPMARSMVDIILVDAIVNGYRPDSVKPKPLNGLRIGVPEYPFYQNLDHEVQNIIDKTLTKLEAAGVFLVRADYMVPEIKSLNNYVDFFIVLHECRRDFPSYLAKANLTVAALTEQIADQDIKRYFKDFYLNADYVTQERYPEVMQKYRAIMVKTWERYFTKNQVDYIIYPATILPARPLAGSRETVELNGEQVSTSGAYLQNTSISSNVGMAGISIPIGFTKDGLPVGLEVDVLSGNDMKLLELCLSLEMTIETMSDMGFRSGQRQYCKLSHKKSTCF